jgi:hypothetical protein
MKNYLAFLSAAALILATSNSCAQTEQKMKGSGAREPGVVWKYETGG